MNIVGVIPARMGSSRFPGKPLAEISGIAMIGHVYNRCSMATILSDIYVATCASILAITMLYLSSESRAFGVTGSPLSDLVVSALIIAISQIYLRQSLTQRYKYSFLSFILFVQIIMTQTRGAWLSLLLAVLFLILLLKLFPIGY